MEAVFIPDSRRGSTQSRGNLSYGGRLYRFQKELVGGKFRLMCAKAERNFKCAGFAGTAGSVAGAAVLRCGGHAARCEPSAAMADVASIRQDFMADACGVGGLTPTRAVSIRLAQSSPASAHSRPSLTSFSRTAREREVAAGEGGASPNYQSREDLSTPRKVLRLADRGNFLLRAIGPGEYRK